MSSTSGRARPPELRTVSDEGATPRRQGCESDRDPPSPRRAPDLLDGLAVAERAALGEGCRRFDAGRFFDAHEVWEDAWRVASGDVRLLLQGLIQVAAAFHKGVVQRRPAGMVRLLDAALPKLEAGGGLARLGLADVRDELRRWREAAARWAGGEPPPSHAPPRLSV
jgi:uncharacterized protein